MPKIRIKSVGQLAHTNILDVIGIGFVVSLYVCGFYRVENTRKGTKAAKDDCNSVRRIKDIGSKIKPIHKLKCTARQASIKTTPSI